MKSKINLFLISSATLFFMCGVVYGQKTVSVDIKFDDAMALTMSRSLLLEAKRYEYQSVDKERKATISLRSPQIDVVGNFSMMSKDLGIDANHYKPIVKEGIDLIMPGATSLKPVKFVLSQDWFVKLQDKNFGVVGATIRMPIFMGGKIDAANKAARVKLKEVSEQIEETKGELFSELTERYFGLSLANAVITVREQVRNGMKHHYEDALELEKNGIIAKGEKLYSEMHLSKAQTEYDKSIRDAQTIGFALSNTMNDSVSYTPSTPLFVMRSIGDINYYIDRAVINNTKLKQVRLKRDLAQAGVSAARADFFPHLSAMGAVSAYDYRVMDMLPRAVAGVNISFKIFNGLNREFKYSASKMKVKQVEALEQKGVKDISMLVEKLYNSIISLGEQFFSYDTTLKFAEEYLRIKEKAFSEGMATSSDVVDARLNLAKTKIERLQIAFQYDVMLGHLLEVCGIYDQYMIFINSTDAVAIR